jgi:hypothetical protein
LGALSCAGFAEEDEDHRAGKSTRNRWGGNVRMMVFAGVGHSIGTLVELLTQRRRDAEAQMKRLMEGG